VFAGFVLSLGPVAIWSNHELGPAPYMLLRRFAPGFRNVRYPECLSILLVLGLAPLVAMGLARLRPRLGTGGLLALSAVVFLEHLSIPQVMCPMPAAAEAPSVYRWLRDQPSARVVAEVPSAPYLQEGADALPMYYATIHGKRTVQGYTSYFPPTYQFTRWRLFHFPSPESVAFLQRFGVDTVVVSPRRSRWPSAHPRSVRRDQPVGVLSQASFRPEPRQGRLQLDAQGLRRRP